MFSPEHSDEPEVYREGDIEAGLKRLSEINPARLIGHNVIKYDIPLIQKLYPWWDFPKARVVDTLILSRILYSDIYKEDQKRAMGALTGRHSLEAWGVRLGKWKGDYAKVRAQKLIDAHETADLPPPTEDEIRAFVWGSWNQDLEDYGIQDVAVGRYLWFKRIGPRLNKYLDTFRDAARLEHDLAWIIGKQERNGFPFNEKKAAALYTKLRRAYDDKASKLDRLFPPWQITKDGEPQFFKVGARKGQPKLMEFNPRSRDHVADRLKSLYDWKPVEFTPGGKPKVDEKVLKDLPYAPAQALAELYMLQKRLGQLGEGAQAWLVQSCDGLMHGSVNTLGAVTARATHSWPNMSQVPASDAPFGDECRALFGSPSAPLLRRMGVDHHEPWKLVGCDASGLELRALGHYLARIDGGEYAEKVVSGDPHWGTVMAWGVLPEGTERDDSDPLHKLLRAAAKTFIYAFLYGAGNKKLALILLDAARKQVQRGLGDTILREYFGGVNAPSEAVLGKVGKKIKSRFFTAFPALKKLVEEVKTAAKKRGYLVALDGRHIPVRHAHAALNTLLQSFGAIVCKRWIVLWAEAMHAAGYIHGWDGDFALNAWSHDEIQFSTKEALAPEVASLCREAVRRAGEYYELRCPLAGEAIIGDTWADTH